MRSKNTTLCVLLCLFLVGAILTSCRRQRAHVESMKASDEATESAPADPVVLDSAWLSDEVPAHILSNQLMLILSTEYDSQAEKYLATLQIKFPSSEVELLDNLTVGSRKSFEFEGTEYMVDVLSVGSGRAQFSITRKL